MTVALLAPRSVGAAVATQGTATGAGSARGEFLTLATGARAAGMGEAFTAVADDATAVTVNPGGLGQQTSVGAVAMYDVLGPGAAVEFLAAAWPVGPVTAGLGVAMLQFGSYDLRDATGAKTGTDAVSDLAAIGAVAIANPAVISGWSGCAVAGAREAAGGMALGVSVGSLIPVGTDLALGVTAARLGPKSGGFGLPAELRAGAAWRPSGIFRLSGEGGFTLADHQPLVAVGVEIAPVRVALVRAGYRWIGRAAPPGLTGLTAGAGVRLGSFGLDYAYQPFGELATTHRISILYAGPPAAGRADNAPAVPPAGTVAGDPEKPAIKQKAKSKARKKKVAAPSPPAEE